MPADLAVVLNRAADLITPPGAWTQGSYARDAEGCPVPLDDPYAECFCVAGAIARFAKGEDWADGLQIVRRTLNTGRAVPFVSVSGWNDEAGRTQAEAVQLLRDAARLAEREGATNA